MSWISITTDVGRALMNAIPAGHQLTIDRATVGSGVVAEVDLRQQTAVTNEKMDAVIADVTKTGGYFNYTKMKVNVGPAPNATGAFTAHQIGIWGRLDGEGDHTLLFLTQDSDAGVSVPTVNTSSSFVFAMYLYISIQDDEAMTISVDGGALVDQAQLDAEKLEMDAKYVHYSDLANGGKAINRQFALDARQGARIDDLDNKVMKITTGQAGGSIVVPYEAAKGVEAVLICEPPRQTGSGTPSASNIRPFDVDTIASYTYSYKTPGSSTWIHKNGAAQSTEDFHICGSMYNIMTREFFITHGYIASYAGEKLPGRWLSDRNAYVEGLSPSIGAEVVYELPGPQRLVMMRPASAFEFTDEGNYEFEGGGSDGYVIARMYPKVDDKIDRSEIVNNLTSTATDKPLSAAQGKFLNDSMLICGAAVNVECDASSVGINYADFNEPQAPSGYSRIGYMMYSSSYRIAALGSGGGRLIYYVNTASTTPLYCYLVPIYKKQQ